MNRLLFAGFLTPHVIRPKVSIFSLRLTVRSAGNRIPARERWERDRQAAAAMLLIIPIGILTYCSGAVNSARNVKMHLGRYLKKARFAPNTVYSPKSLYTNALEYSYNSAQGYLWRFAIEYIQ